jgi:membrane protein implicated in regulation of membrane protease activity
MKPKSNGQLLMFYGSAFVVCLIVAVAALAKGSVALGVVLLLFAAIMAAILVSRRPTG